MSRDELRIGEAVAALTARLDDWGVTDARAKAHEYVNDMLRHGWRPRAADATLPPMNPRATPANPEAVALARANLLQAKAIPGFIWVQLTYVPTWRIGAWWAYRRLVRTYALGPFRVMTLRNRRPA